MLVQWIVKSNMLHIIREFILAAVVELSKVMFGTEAANRLETVPTGLSIIIFHPYYDIVYK